MKYLLLIPAAISELRIQKPNPRVIAWIDTIDPDSAYLTIITIGEIRKGIEKDYLIPNAKPPCGPG